MFTNFRFVRRLLGGKWYKVGVDMPTVAPYWRRDPPKWRREYQVETESYQDSEDGDGRRYNSLSPRKK